MITRGLEVAWELPSQQEDKQPQLSQGSAHTVYPCLASSQRRQTLGAPPVLQILPVVKLSAFAFKWLAYFA